MALIPVTQLPGAATALVAGAPAPTNAPPATPSAPPSNSLMSLPRDRDWVRQSFAVPKGGLDGADYVHRNYTSAYMKFTDTRLGGNFSINNPPQYTPYADPPLSGKVFLDSAGHNTTSGGNHNSSYVTATGMGGFYSEQLDDNAQWVHFRFGVPAYIGSWQFFTGFFNNDAATLANSGRGIFSVSGGLYYIGRALGFLTALPLWPIIAVGSIMKYLSHVPSSRYYYMKESMVTYWSRVNVITNALGVNMGLVPRMQSNDDPTVQQEADQKYTAADRSTYHVLAPDIFREDGAIDVFAVSNRAQRLANEYYDRLKTLASAGNGSGNTQSPAQQDIFTSMLNYQSEFLASDPKVGSTDAVSFDGTYGKLDPNTGNLVAPDQSNGLAYLYHNSIAGNMTGTQNNSSPGSTNPPNVNTSADINAVEPSWRQQWQSQQQSAAGGDPNTGATPSGLNAPDPNVTVPTIGGWWKDKGDFATYALSNLRDGSQFVTFKVDYNGSVSESFSNSSGESQIAQTINGKSADARNLSFNVGNFQTGTFLDSIVGGVGDLLKGIADSVHLSGILTLAGAGLVDIPQKWESSSTTWPSSSFTIELRSPYGNVMSRFMNLWVPLAMLLSGVLPRSTGKQSYTSPFLCEMYYKGHNQIRLGMIDSMTIRRGVGNLGWGPGNIPLGIDVDFSVKDFSSVMHSPITPAFSLLNPLGGVTDDDNPFTDYLASLSSLTMAEQVYSERALMLNLTRRWSYVKSTFTSAAISNEIFNSRPGRILSSVMRAASVTMQNK